MNNRNHTAPPVTAQLFAVTPTAGVPAWQHCTGDHVNTPHGPGRIATVFEFPLLGVQVDGRLLTFRQTEVSAA